MKWKAELWKLKQNSAIIMFVFTSESTSELELILSTKQNDNYSDNDKVDISHSIIYVMTFCLFPKN